MNNKINVSHETIDNINNPSHYTNGKIETIEYIESTPYFEGFCLGNVIKYVSRCNFKKSKLEDLKKSKWYLERYIKYLENQENLNLENKEKLNLESKEKNMKNNHNLLKEINRIYTKEVIKNE